MSFRTFVIALGCIMSGLLAAFSVYAEFSIPTICFLSWCFGANCAMAFCLFLIGGAR